MRAWKEAQRPTSCVVYSPNYTTLVVLQVNQNTSDPERQAPTY